MHPRYMLSASVFLVLVSLVAAVAGGEASPGPQTAAPSAPASGAPEYTSVRSLPDAVTVATLSNGLTVIVQENHVAPVATVRCFVKNTGSAFEGKYLGAGLSHVLEHVVAGGTTSKRSEKEIEQIIDTFGGATNAYTSDDTTAYYIDCPAKNTLMAIELMADSMQRISFEPREFERELAVVKQELADGEVDRSRVLWKLLNLTVYQEHPARHPVIGYLDVLNNTNNEAIIDFYRERYIPNNQVFVVVGDVKTEEILDHVARQWAGTPRGRETVVAMPEEPLQLAPREALREMDGSTYDYVFAWPTVKLSHPDLYALDVAAYILGEGESSRLVQRLRYEKQVALSVSSASSTPHFVTGFFAVMGSSTPQTFAEAEKEILAAVYRLREEPVSDAELAKAKKQKAAELVFGRQTVQQAAGSLGRSLLSTGDPLFDQKYAENIQQVTAEQIRDVARRYFDPQRLNRVVISPPGQNPAVAGASSKAAESDVRLVRLPNGLRVLVKRHAQLPLVNLQAYVLGGTLVDTPETAGRSALLAAMLDKGTAGHTAREIAEYFDSIGGRLDMTAGRSTVYGSTTVLRDDFAAAAALFAECFTRPTFPEDEFARVKTLALGAIARRQDDPQQEAFEVFYDHLPAGSPYHIIQGGKAETVEPMTVEDLRQYHARYFVPNNMLVTVFGDIEPEAAVELVKKHFGELKPDPSFAPIEFDRPNDIPETVVRHKQTAKEIGVVLLGYPTVSILDAKDHAALTVLDAMSSGYSYPGGWLHNELRGAGLVYFVHALAITGPAPGFLAVMAQTQPNKIDEVVERIRRNLERAKKGEFSDEEFRTAKQMIVALHAQENTTISGQAQQAALDELYGLGYDYDRTFDARIEAVTRDDVTRVAKQYLDHYLQVTTSPEPR